LFAACLFAAVHCGSVSVVAFKSIILMLVRCLHFSHAPLHSGSGE
jgi:hypothetical protein